MTSDTRVSELPGHVDTRVWRAAGEENFAHFTCFRAKIKDFYVLLLLGTGAPNRWILRFLDRT